MDTEVKEEVLDDLQDISEEIFDDNIVKEEYTIDERNAVQFEITEIDSDLKTKRTPYKCKICNSEWEYQSWLEEHMIFHSNDCYIREDKEFKCPDCPKTFKYKGSLENHSKYHIETCLPSRLECQVCNKMMSTVQIMRQHMRKQHGEIFTAKSSLDIHMKRYHEQKPLVCEECGKKFRNQHNYEKHVADHLLRKKIQNPEGNIAMVKAVTPTCTVCKIVCKSMADLKEHIETHKVENRFECGFCGMKAKSKNIIQNHIKAIHFKIRNPKNEKNAECPICSKKFTSHNLKTHMFTHSTERPFACDVCDKTFKTKDNVKVHKKCHVPAKEQEKKCSYCEESFRNRYTFGEHMRINHRGLPVNPEGPPFKCTICKSAFRLFGDLKDHVTIHRRESVKCAICDKIFPYKARIRRHIEGTHLKRKNQQKTGVLIGKKSFKTT